MKINLTIGTKTFYNCIFRKDLTIDVPLIQKTDIDFFLNWISNNKSRSDTFSDMKCLMVTNADYVRPFFNETGEIFSISFLEFSDDDSIARLECESYEIDEH